MKLPCHICRHWVEDAVIGLEAAERELAKHVAAEHRPRLSLIPSDALRPCSCRGNGTCIACQASAQYARGKGSVFPAVVEDKTVNGAVKVTFYGQTRAAVMEEARAWLLQNSGGEA